MVGFHWHKVNRLKETYRFFRDDKNRREYDGTRKLINAAQWLSAFYEKNSEANQMIKTCLDLRKEEIDSYLQSTEESSDLKMFESLLGEPAEAHPEGCEGGDDSPSSSSPVSSAPTTTFGNVDVQDVSLGLGESSQNELPEGDNTSTGNNTNSDILTQETSAMESSDVGSAGGNTGVAEGTGGKVYNKGAQNSAKARAVKNQKD